MQKKFVVMPCWNTDTKGASEEEVMVVELTEELHGALDYLMNGQHIPVPLFGDPILLRYDVPRHWVNIYAVPEIKMPNMLNMKHTLLCESNPFRCLDEVDSQWEKPAEDRSERLVQVEVSFGGICFITHEEYGPTREYTFIEETHLAELSRCTPVEKLLPLFSLDESHLGE